MSIPSAENARPPARTFPSFVAVDIAQRNVSVLLPDTCSLLDVVRTPRRRNVSARDVVAVDAINDALIQSRLVNVIAQQVAAELDDRYQHVVDEAGGQIATLLDEVDRLAKWAATAGHAGVRGIANIQLAHERAVRDLDHWLDHSVGHPMDQDVPVRAFGRVMAAKTPSKLGKESAKDCVVTESCLDIATALRTAGHSAPIVFVSSNTNDYASETSSTLNADLKSEFDTLDIRYARQLHEAVHRLELQSTVWNYRVRQCRSDHITSVGFTPPVRPEMVDTSYPPSQPQHRNHYG